MTIDVYDLAVEYLKAKPSEISEAWDEPLLHPAGILFQVASPTGQYEKAFDRISDCGDLCEIVSEEAVAYTDEMTDIIREDERLPRFEQGRDTPAIATDILEAFAEWQRVFDMTWERDPVEKLRAMGFKPESFGIRS